MRGEEIRVFGVPLELKKKFLFIPFLFLLLILLVWKLGLLNINQVFLEMKNTPCVSEEGIKKELDLVGKNILFTKEDIIKKKLKEKFPCIKDIKLDKKFFNKVEIRVEGRVGLVKVASFKEKEILNLSDLEASPSTQTALINWSFPSSGDKWLADGEGVLFASGQDEDLPTLFYPEEDLKIGQRIDWITFAKIGKVLLFLKTLESDFGRSMELKLSGNNLILKSGQNIALSLEKDISRQLASLQLILQKAKIDNKSMETIDLRFDKPVVVYSPVKK